MFGEVIEVQANPIAAPPALQLGANPRRAIHDGQHLSRPFHSEPPARTPQLLPDRLRTAARRGHLPVLLFLVVEQRQFVFLVTFAIPPAQTSATTGPARVAPAAAPRPRGSPFRLLTFRYHRDHHAIDAHV
ncbi:MAG: hypothetical protein WCO84_07065, partial [bacterium]